MSIGKKRVWKVGLALTLVATGLAFASMLILQDILGILIIVGVLSVDLYWFFAVYRRRKKPRYPLVPPEGKGDVYLPRTDIPRPIHEDFRLMEEKKKRFAKIDRWRRKRSKKNV